MTGLQCTDVRSKRKSTVDGTRTTTKWSDVRTGEKQPTEEGKGREDREETKMNKKERKERKGSGVMSHTGTNIRILIQKRRRRRKEGGSESQHDRPILHTTRKREDGEDRRIRTNIHQTEPICPDSRIRRKKTESRRQKDGHKWRRREKER